MGIWLRAIVCVSCLSASVSASCPEWLPGFSDAGLDGAIWSYSTYNGSVFAGGQFTSANGVATPHVARWDGTSWSPVGGGLDGVCLALAVHDDGTGPAIYAGGEFDSAGGVAATNVARWNGSNWSPVGAGIPGNGAVNALCEYDDGTGAALYAGGSFFGGGINGIARWDGTAWQPVGGSVGTVNALAAHDDGSGLALYAAGSLLGAGGTAAQRIARWDGTAWSAVGSGFDFTAYALTEHDDGTGKQLYAGGDFIFCGTTLTRGVARWDGTSWNSIGGAAVNMFGVRALRSFDDGTSTSALFAGGNFTFPLSYIARWDGSTWETPGGGVNGSVFALESFDDGAEAALLAGGVITSANGQCARYATRLANTGWTALTPCTMGVGGEARAFEPFTTPDGEQLHVAGQFNSAGVFPVANIARFDGDSWNLVGAGLNSPVNALERFDDGNGDTLYAAGQFTMAGLTPANRIARWDGAQWSAVGSGVNGSALTLLTHDDGSGESLFVGGVFVAAGGAPASRIARWDGSSFHPLGAGVSGAGIGPPAVNALVEHDDGNGTALYAGGNFITAGGGAANRVAKWNGSSWSRLGAGLDDVVHALAVYDDGSGPALYVGGRFQMAGGAPASRIARWDGSGWSPVAGGIGGTEVRALAVYDDGSGPALYATGDFSTAGGNAAANIARFHCGAWSAVGAGIEGRGDAAIAWDTGAGETLYVGGDLSSAGGTPADGLAAYSGCGPAIVAYGQGCPGSGGFTPSLAIDGCPAAGGTLGVSVEDGLGGSSCVLFLGTGTGSTPIGSGCSLLVSGLLPAQLVLPLTPGGPGEGTLAISGTLSATLAPLSLSLQGFVIDGGVPLGASATNAVSISLQ